MSDLKNKELQPFDENTNTSPNDVPALVAMPIVTKAPTVSKLPVKGFIDRLEYKSEARKTSKPIKTERKPMVKPEMNKVLALPLEKKPELKMELKMEHGMETTTELRRPMIPSFSMVSILSKIPWNKSPVTVKQMRAGLVIGLFLIGMCAGYQVALMMAPAQARVSATPTEEHVKITKPRVKRRQTASRVKHLRTLARHR